MPIHAYVAVQTADDEYQVVYAHLPTNPDEMLKILSENYETQSKALELLKGGDLVQIGKSLDQCIRFNPYETLVMSRELLDNLDDENHDFYIMTIDGDWICF